MITEKSCMWIAVLILLTAGSAGGQGLFEGEKALVLLEKDAVNAEQNIAAVKKVVRKAGGHIMHVFFPHVVKGYVPESAVVALKALPFVEKIFYDEIDLSALGDAINDNLIAMAWNQNLAGDFALRAVGVQGEHYDDARLSPDLKDANTGFTLRGQNNYYQTSEYLMGEVSVGVVFVESDGTLDPKTEHWYEEEREDAFGQVEKALEWWAEKGGYPASLTFTYEIERITTKFEPINRPFSQANLWVEDGLGKLGYHDAEDFVLSREYDNDLRDKYNSDWAITIFVVDASDDPDGEFKDNTGIAWAFLGGPYLITSNKCNGWGLDNVWLVVAHEVGHLFNALDEYEGASSPSATSGRLNVVNGNHDLGGGTAECLMKSNQTTLCEFTLGQIGWVDYDENGFYDADYIGISQRFNTEMVKKGSLKSALNGEEAVSAADVTVDDSGDEILFFDDFTEKRGWHQDASAYYSEGKYHVFDKDYGITSWLETPYEDFAVQVKTNWLEGDEGTGYGLMFRAKDINNGFMFLVGGDGSFCLGSFDYGNWTYLVEWEDNKALNKRGQNSLRVVCEGNSISLFINGIHVRTIQNGRHREGFVGMAVYPQAHISFDDFLITRPK